MGKQEEVTQKSSLFFCPIDKDPFAKSAIRQGKLRAAYRNVKISADSGYSRKLVSTMYCAKIYSVGISEIIYACILKQQDTC